MCFTALLWSSVLVSSTEFLWLYILVKSIKKPQFACPFLVSLEPWFASLFVMYTIQPCFVYIFYSSILGSLASLVYFIWIYLSCISLICMHVKIHVVQSCCTNSSLWSNNHLQPLLSHARTEHTEHIQNIINSAQEADNVILNQVRLLF